MVREDLLQDLAITIVVEEAHAAAMLVYGTQLCLMSMSSYGLRFGPEVLTMLVHKDVIKVKELLQVPKCCGEPKGSFKEILHMLPFTFRYGGKTD